MGNYISIFHEFQAFHLVKTMKKNSLTEKSKFIDIAIKLIKI